MTARTYKYTNEHIQYLLQHEFEDRDDLLIDSQIDAARDPHGRLLARLRRCLKQKQRKTILQAINLKDNHWVALFIKPPEAPGEQYIIWYVDTINFGRQGVNANVLNVLQTLFGPRVQIEVFDKQLQFDGHNCGPWVVEIFKRLVADPLGGTLEELQPEHIAAIRAEQERLLIPINQGAGGAADDGGGWGQSSATCDEDIRGRDAVLVEDERDEEDDDDYISDDSDVEEERLFMAQSEDRKDDIDGKAHELIKRSKPIGIIKTRESKKEKTASGLSELYLFRGNGKNELKKPDYCIEGSKIHIGTYRLKYDEQRDLSQLSSEAAIIGRLTRERSLRFATTFWVAAFRGIHYSLHGGYWTQAIKRQHRKLNEIGEPLYSRAVTQVVGEDATPEQKRREAVLRRDRMFRLHQLGEIRGLKIPGESKDSEQYVFANPGLAVEDMHVKKYAGTRKKLQEWESCRSSRDVRYKRINKAEEVVALHVDSTEIFHLSCSFLAHQAVEYSTGEKMLGTDKRVLVLRPVWNRQGRIIRKHVGKIYLMLFQPYELPELGIMDVLALDDQGDIYTQIQVVKEIEATCPVFIPENHVVFSMIAEFPSFDGEYKRTYLKKYGLTKEYYELFRKYICSENEADRKLAEIRLRHHLCRYWEAFLVDQAQQEVRKRGGILVYPNGVGGYHHILPPVARKSTKIKDPKAKLAAEQRNIQRQKLRGQRKFEEGRELQGFLVDMLREFDVVVFPTQKHDDLIETISLMAEVTREQLQSVFYDRHDELELSEDMFERAPDKLVADLFNDRMQKLNALARLCGIRFTIRCPNFKDSGRLVIGGESETNVDIYYMGGDSYAILVAKDEEPRLDLAQVRGYISQASTVDGEVDSDEEEDVVQGGAGVDVVGEAMDDEASSGGETEGGGRETPIPPPARQDEPQRAGVRRRRRVRSRDMDIRDFFDPAKIIAERREREAKRIRAVAGSIDRAVVDMVISSSDDEGPLPSPRPE